MTRIRVVILGAAGRDFHNFNLVFRDNSAYQVIAFTATQIPNISGRKYPASLAGKLYPSGIPIIPEEELTACIRSEKIDEAVFAYSDVSHEHVMHKASESLAAGANFRLLGPRETMLPGRKPVIAVCAVRTGCGKSQTSERVADILESQGKKVAIVRHPMPYGDLEAQRAQVFRTFDDLVKAQCTIEEREEYERHLFRGRVVLAGVDYAAILQLAEEAADVVLWDGGNNDLPFFKPDLHIVVADPLRVGHETRYHPGETNLRMADVVVINKINSARPEDVETLTATIRCVNPGAEVLPASSVLKADKPELLKGKKALVVEDGPTLTHGEMAYGAGYAAAREHGAEVVSPYAYAQGSLKATYEKYPQVRAVLPAVGYGDEQLADLAATIAAVPCDVVVVATPIDLAGIISIPKPCVRITYALGPEPDQALRRRITAVL